MRDGYLMISSLKIYCRAFAEILKISQHLLT